jgi:hypothetical protein
MVFSSVACVVREEFAGACKIAQVVGTLARHVLCVVVVTDMACYHPYPGAVALAQGGRGRPACMVLDRPVWHCHSMVYGRVVELGLTRGIFCRTFQLACTLYSESRWVA